MVTVFSTPTCAPCRVSKARLREAGIPFEDIDLTAEPGVLHALKERLGVTVIQTPLVEFRGELFGLVELRRIIETIQADGEA